MRRSPSARVVRTAWAVAGGVGAAFVGLVLVIPLVAIGGAPPPGAGSGGGGIDATVYAAYALAAEGASEAVPGCTVRWQILAGLGKVESGNAAGRTVDPDGNVTPRIVGVALDGTAGVMQVADTDAGRWDGDTTWDRAVGPLQLLPTTWQRYGEDGNDDDTVDPHNVFDAARGAVAYLCAGGPIGDTDDKRLAAAVRRYNDSDTYVDQVLEWIHYYDTLAELPRDGEVSAASYALPLDRAIFERQPSYLTAPHHDYAAVDVPVPEGTPVYAVTGGTVRAITSLASRCGYGVVLGGDDGWDYVFCHGTSLLVEVGDRVDVGAPILLSGNTGNSDGPHLHFGVQSPAGIRRCPQPLLQAWIVGEAMDPAGAPTHGCSY